MENTFKGLDEEKFKKLIANDPKLRAIWKSGSNKDVLMMAKQNKTSRGSMNSHAKKVMKEFTKIKRNNPEAYMKNGNKTFH